MCAGMALRAGVPPPDRGKRKRHADDGATTIRTKRAKQRRHTQAPWWTDRSTAISSDVLPVPRSTDATVVGCTSWIHRVESNTTHPPPRIPFKLEPIAAAKKVVERIGKLSNKVMPVDCVMRTWKIKLAPSAAFKQLVQQRWFAVTRLWYNLALDLLKRRHPNGFKKTPSKFDTEKWLNRCECAHVTPGQKCHTHPFENHRLRHYLFNLPNPTKLNENHSYCSREMKKAVIHQLCDSIGKTIVSLKAVARTKAVQKGRKTFTISDFNLKFRTQQDRCQSVDITCNSGNHSIRWTRDGFTFLPEFNPGPPVRAKSNRDMLKLHQLYVQQNADHPLGFKRPMKASPDTVGCPFTVTLKYDRVQRSYSLCIPYWKKKHVFEPVATASPNTTRSARKLAVATDPGVRAFHTTYDSGGTSVKYGVGGDKRMLDIGLKMDRLKTVWYAPLPITPNRPLAVAERKRAKRAYNRHQAKLENLKRDVHWKLATELCRSYEHVMIPVFAASQMVRRSDEHHTRTINATTVRKMLNWSHFEFRQRLKHKAEELGTRVHEVGEEYTTVGCGACGRINEVGSGTWYKCAYCPYECDRDRGAARTIIIKNIETHVGKYDLPTGGA
jgi:hypothetical protein